jgi:hypothetical protein
LRGHEVGATDDLRPGESQSDEAMRQKKRRALSVKFELLLIQTVIPPSFALDVQARTSHEEIDLESCNARVKIERG